MSLPELVRERLGEERPQARVSLGGDDQLVVTPTRTLIYRAEGLLSGESVEEHAHSAERVAVTEGRRKSTIRLDHGIDGESEFTVPTKRLDDLLEPLFAGILGAAGVIGEDEAVGEVYRQGELTLVITEARVIKHIGTALWDTEYEEYPFEGVTRLDLEAGDVSSQVIVEVDGRPERIKVPSDEARMIRQRVEQALLRYHDASSYAAFREEVAAAAEAEAAAESAADDATADADDGEVDGEPAEDEGFGGAEGFGGIATIGGSEPESTAGSEAGGDAGGTDDSEPDAEAGGVEAGGDGEHAEATELEFGPDAAGGMHDQRVAEELEELRTAVENQTELLEKHHRTLEQLIEELRRGR